MAISFYIFPEGRGKTEFIQHRGMQYSNQISRPSIVGNTMSTLRIDPVAPLGGEDSLTPMGRLFIEPIEMLYAWAAKNEDALSKLQRRRKKQTASKEEARKFMAFSFPP